MPEASEDAGGNEQQLKDFGATQRAKPFFVWASGTFDKNS